MATRSIALSAAVLLASPLFAAKPAETNPAPGKERAIYRCELAGVATFSDRPCGSSIQPHDTSEAAVTTYAAPPVTVPVPVPAKGKSSTTSGPQKRSDAANAAKAKARHADTCERIRNSLAGIRSKMRAGYSAKEGERLRERLKTLQRRSKAEGCR